MPAELVAQSAHETLKVNLLEQISRSKANVLSTNSCQPPSGPRGQDGVVLCVGCETASDVKKDANRKRDGMARVYMRSLSVALGHQASRNGWWCSKAYVPARAVHCMSIEKVEYSARLWLVWLAKEVRSRSEQGRTPKYGAGGALLEHWDDVI